MQEMGRAHPDVDAIAERTVTFADVFGDRGIPSRLLAQLQARPELKDLRVALQTLDVSRACSKLDGRKKECEALAQHWKQASPLDCSADVIAEAASSPRGSPFDTLFGPKGAFTEARSKACDKSAAACNQAQLLVRLGPALQRLWCPSSVTSAPELLRSLTYTLLERDIYLKAIGEQGKAQAALQAADHFFDATRELQLSDIRREEIARGIRVVAHAVRAYAGNGAQAAAWFTMLKTDLESVNLDTPIVLDNFVSLRWENRDNWGARVRLLRDAVKDFLALPLLHGYVSGKTEAIPAVKYAVKRLMNVVDAFASATAEKPSAEQAVRLVSDVMRSLAELSGDIERAQLQAEVAVEDGPLPFGVISSAADLLYDAHDRDWVALAIKISVTLHDQPSIPVELRRSIAFVRVLMSMYQARSADEAKGVFEAELEDLSSRRRRWESFTVDVGALLGAGTGAIWATNRVEGAAAPGRTYVYGLYAPFGIQLAKKCIGGLVYPVDLGAYLIGDGSNKREVDWRDSLRVGAAFYGRPFPTLPLDLVAAGDYHPRFDDNFADVRFMGSLVLELPLYLVY
jgi:hypothetical protein